ncbi:MAG: hypothetical protein OEL69_05385 [Nitrosopumilus sp.]|nr:hypothetical protein [Nitrosopumilus sp.]
MQRSLLLFLESVKSKATQHQYQYYLNKFMKESGYGEDYDMLCLCRTNVTDLGFDIKGILFLI